MRRILWALIALTTMAVVACTKEKSFEETSGGGDNGTGSPDGELLSKIVLQLGSDSATTSFSYDGSKRLLTEANKGWLSIVSDDSLQRVVRNAEGTIQTVTTYPDAISGNVYAYTLRYDEASKRYTSKLSFDEAGNVVDSIAYDVDASGKLVSATTFANYGGGFEVLGKDTIEYDGNNNIAKVSTYKYEDDNWVALTEMAVSYDNQINPLKLSQEAIVLERYQYYGNNNPTKITFVNYAVPSFSREYTITYTYHASGRPATAAIGITGTGEATLPAIFRYQ